MLLQGSSKPHPLLRVMTLAASLALPPVVNAAVIDVDAGASDVLAMDGTCSVREAIINANDNAATWSDCLGGDGWDVVRLPIGTFALDLTGSGEDASWTGDLDVTDDLVLLGDSADATVIDAQAIDRVLHAHAASLTVDRLTITGGSADAVGGGIASDGPLTIIDSVISDNEAGYFTAANDGGGGGVFADGSALLIRTVIGGNRSTLSGGGIRASAPLSLIESSVVHNGSFPFRGGGIFAQAPVTLDDSTIGSNFAEWGGGIYALGTRVGATGSTIHGNGAVGFSGGIMADEIALTNSTVTANTAGTDQCSWAALAADLVHLTHSTVFGNVGVTDLCAGATAGAVTADLLIIEASVLGRSTAFPFTFIDPDTPIDECDVGAVVSIGFNLADDASCLLTSGTDLVGVAPLLDSLGDNSGPTASLLPLPGSPLIDAIPAAQCRASGDQRGLARPFDGDWDGEDQCDIGAVELHAECTAGFDSDGDGVLDACDNCLLVANGTGIPDAGGNAQLDVDFDGIGNACDADLNADFFVGGPDFDVFLSCFNRAIGAGVGPPDDPTCGESDMNGDGFVGGPDFDLFLQRFNQEPGPSGQGCGLGWEVALFLPVLWRRRSVRPRFVHTH